MDFHAPAIECAPAVDQRAFERGRSRMRSDLIQAACVRSETPAQLAAFARTYRAAAERAGAALRVDPNVLLGQWGLETGWGRSIIPGTHNLGNIKDFSGRGVAAVDNQTGSVDKYRVFANPDHFADQFADLIRRKYPAAVGAGAHAGKFGMALKAGGYAEDANYPAKVLATYRMVTGQAPSVPAQARAQSPAAVGAVPDNGWAVYGAEEI